MFRREKSVQVCSVSRHESDCPQRLCKLQCREQLGSIAVCRHCVCAARGAVRFGYAAFTGALQLQRKAKPFLVCLQHVFPAELEMRTVCATLSCLVHSYIFHVHISTYIHKTYSFDMCVYMKHIAVTLGQGAGRDLRRQQDFEKD